MKLINKSLVLFVIALFMTSYCQAQVENTKSDTVKIYGNCGMCKKTIEKAALVKDEAKAEWDADTKMAVITYDSTKTTLDDVLMRIAKAGYDSDQFRAADEDYISLHKCCHYDRPEKKKE